MTFNSDFYPTSESIFERMNVDCRGKIVLEPQAGSGNLVRFLKEYGAKEVLVCENDPRLKIIAKEAGDRFLCDDFLAVTPEQVSHIDLIVMNPPFSSAVTHVIHAWTIAPEGCEIVSLINSNTLSNDYSRTREQLNRLLKDYGDDTNHLGQCFTNAERTTNVEVTCIRLFKPMITESDKWDGFHYVDDEPEINAEGMMPYNDIRAIVNSYSTAVNYWNTVASSVHNMSRLCGSIGMSGGFNFALNHNTTIITKEQFAKEAQKAAWKKVFEKMKIDKYVTKGVKADLNRFVETQQNYPFSMKNVYRMIEVIFGTREQTFNKAIEEAIDNFTKYTHENRFAVEGWKTNSGYMLNEKFILNYVVKVKWTTGMEIETYRSQYEYVEDLIKVLCQITGKDFDKIPSMMYSRCRKDEDGNWIHGCDPHGRKDSYPKYYNQFDTNVWYSSEFFDFKVFKKGTMHLKFRNRKEWELINRMYSKAKGQVLPEKI